MEKEMQYRIIKEIEHYSNLNEQYVCILRLGGIGSQQLFDLIDNAVDVVALSNVSAYWLYADDFEFDYSIDFSKVVETFKVGIKLLTDDAPERMRMARKAAYLNELDKDEINRLLVGFHVSACMEELCKYILFKPYSKQTSRGKSGKTSLPE